MCDDISIWMASEREGGYRVAPTQTVERAAHWSSERDGPVQPLDGRTSYWRAIVPLLSLSLHSGIDNTHTYSRARNEEKEMRTGEKGMNKAKEEGIRIFYRVRKKSRKDR